MLALTPVMGAATAYRAGVGHADVWYQKAPRLMSLWFDAIEPGRDQVKAGRELRDEVLKLMKESSDLVHEEFNRGIEDLKEFSSRTESEQPAGAGSSSS
jgi:hypothetical protein